MGLCMDTKTSMISWRRSVMEPVYSLTLVQPAQQFLRLVNA